MEVHREWLQGLNTHNVPRQLDSIGQALQKEQQLHIAFAMRLDKEGNRLQCDIDRSLKESHAA
eukprot:6425913-Karenia_brevis.AAC.1